MPPYRNGSRSRGARGGGGGDAAAASALALDRMDQMCAELDRMCAELDRNMQLAAAASGSPPRIIQTDGDLPRCMAFLEYHRRRATTGSSTSTGAPPRVQAPAPSAAAHRAEQHQHRELKIRIEANIALAESELYCARQRVQKARAACTRACMEIESAGPVMLYDSPEAHGAVSRRLEAACAASDDLKEWSTKHWPNRPDRY